MNLADYIMSRKGSGGANAMQAQEIGRAASRSYLTAGTPLNESIGGMAKEAGLNYEQIRRAAEVANNETFLGLFRTGYDRNVTFQVADAAEISRGVHLGALPQQEKTASAHVSTAAPRYIPGSEGFSLERMLRVKPLEKQAAAAPTRDELARKTLLLKDEQRALESEQALLSSDFMSKLAHLNRMVHQEINGGTPPWAIGAAVVSANPSKGLFGVIAQELGNSMDTRDMVKAANADFEVVDDNPVTGLVQDLEAVAQKLVANEETSQRTRAAIEEMLTLLRGSPESNPTAELFAESPTQPAAGMPQAGAPVPDYTQGV